MEYIIKANQINKYFSNYHALKYISINIPKGEIFGLLGPNGAGKTTLIRILNGIIQADSGEILFNDSLLNSSINQKIGYLPEERGLYKKMKVYEQLLYLAQLKGLSKTDAKTKINYWLNKFEIEDWKNKTVEELSKGMAQKIQFIVTVIHEPELLILDEPFSGFDPINSELIKNEILDLKNKGISVILSTHNMNSVEELCNEILLLNKGEIIITGKVSEIRNQFSKNEFEIIFIGNMISFTTALWTGFELVHHELIEKNKFKTIVKSLGKNGINELLGALISSCKIVSVNEITPSMNEVFIEQITQNSAQLNE